MFISCLYTFDSNMSWEAYKNFYVEKVYVVLLLNAPLFFYSLIWNWATTSVIVWFSRKLKNSLFFKELCDFSYFHTQKKEQTSDKIWFLDDLIFYNSNFIIVIL